MRIGVPRIGRSLFVLLVLAGVLWTPAPGKEVPLQSPILRTQRLKFSISVPPGFSNYGQPLSIQSVYPEDLDGDGDTDLLVYNDPCSAFILGGFYRIYLTAGGTVESITGTALAARCSDSWMFGGIYTAGDFDRDGLLDFASWGSSTLFLQRPGGEVEERPISLPLDPPEPGGWIVDNPRVASADLNRDGIPDVVVAEGLLKIDWSTWLFRFSMNLYVFLADGEGGFVRSQKIAAPADPEDDFHLFPAALKDFTGDGIPDYLGHGSGPKGDWEILPGDGVGHLLTPDEGIAVPSLPQPNPPYPNPSPVAASGDLNGDGLADLVLTPAGDWPSVWLSAGVGQFVQSPPLPKPAQCFSWGDLPIHIRDLDADGREDLQVFCSSYAANYLGQPDGTLGPLQEVRLGIAGRGSVRMHWDEDAHPDLVYYGGQYDYDDTTNLIVFLSEGGPGRDQIPIPVPWAHAYPLSVGDFDGDGDKDLLFAARDRVVVYRGDGQGGFLALPNVTSPPADRVEDALAADFNRDGRDDIVVLTSPESSGGQGSVALYLGQPPGEPPALFVTKTAGANPISVAAADLDGDGNLDLLVADMGVPWPDCGYSQCFYEGTVSAYMGQGGGSLGDPVLVIDSGPLYILPAILDIEVGLVNGDRIPDLLILFTDRPLGRYYYGAWANGLGDGSFDWPYMFTRVDSSSVTPMMPPADVNGDGLPDLGFSPTYFPLIPKVGFVAYLGNDEGDLSLFATGSSCPSGLLSSGRFIDLDGDRYLDLMGGYRGLLFGAGAGTGEFFCRGPSYSPSGLPLMDAGQFPGDTIPAPLYADFNDDGREDVVVWDLLGIYLLLNRAGRVASDPAESLQEPLPDAPHVDPEIDLAEIQARVGSYDFTGSGIPQGALVFTLSLNDYVPPAEGEAAGGIAAIRDGSAPAGGGLQSRARHPGPHAHERNRVRRPGMKSGTFHLFLNFGEPLLDSDGDGTLDLSIANALEEPGLEGIPLADVSLVLRLDGGDPIFAGLRDLGLFSSVDRERGIATFVVPFEDLLSALTPAERLAMDRGDGTGRLFLWAVSRLFSDRDRVPDTNDGSDPTIRSEVREFRFPLQDLRVTPCLDFGDVLITTHRNGPLTLANHGVGPVTVGDLEMQEPTLSLPASPPFTVPAASGTTMRLRYAPMEHATFSDNLIFTLDDPGQPEISTYLRGRGVAPIIEVSTALLDFGSAPVGLASGYQFFQVRNLGDTTLYVDWEITDAQFSPYSWTGDPTPLQGNFTVGAGSLKGFYLYFHPDRLGLTEAAFRMHTNDPFHPQVDVVLRGTGTPPEPRISVSCPATLIKDVPIGEEGSVTCPVSNNGSGPLHILSVTSSSPQFSGFVEPTTIEPGSEGILTVTYRPVAWGVFSTTITIASDDPTHPAVGIRIRGQAFEPPPVGHVSPTLLDFGDVHQGDSPVLSFDVSNTGTGPLWLTGSSPVIPSYCAYQADLSLPGLVLPGESLAVHVTLTADIDKTLCNSFYFNTNDPALSTVTITLKAKILSPIVVYTPSSLEFAATPVGSSTKRNLAVGNEGADALWITRVTFGRSEFSLGGPLPPPIPIGGVANIPIVFTPVTIGSVYSYVTVYTNDVNKRSFTVWLYGTAVPAMTLRTLTDLVRD